MEKKQYTRPEVQAYQVNPSEVICGSETIPTGGPIDGKEEGFEKGANASRYSDWGEYLSN